jgi:hypothetical protein
MNKKVLNMKNVIFLPPPRPSAFLYNHHCIRCSGDEDHISGGSGWASLNNSHNTTPAGDSGRFKEE